MLCVSNQQRAFLTKLHICKVVCGVNPTKKISKKGDKNERKTIQKTKDVGKNTN